MFRVINALNSLVGTILSLAILALLGVAGWIGFQTYYGEKWALQQSEQELVKTQAKIAGLSGMLQDKQGEIKRLTTQLGSQVDEINGLNKNVNQQRVEIGKLNKDLEEKEREIQRLATAVQFLKVDHRIAEITVVSQQGSAETEDLTTTFSFVEVNEQGQTLEQPRAFTVNGDLIYLDAWVVKFSDEFVEVADPLRATSVCLFRRIFGENQPPLEGFVLDPVGSRPAAYNTGGKMSELEEEIWAQFWEIANDPERAKQVGVRAAHGEAPSIKLLPGKRYKVQLRASGGLSVVPEDAPPEATTGVF